MTSTNQLRHRHVDGDGAGGGPQHEARRDGDDVEHGDVLEPRAVEHRQRRRRRRRRRRSATGRSRAATPSAASEQHRADDLGRARPARRRRRSGGALRRVGAVGLDVERVVPQVDAAGGEAEGDERQQPSAERRPVVEHAGRAGSGEHEHVLHPLLAAAPCAAAPRGRRRSRRPASGTAVSGPLGPHGVVGVGEQLAVARRVAVGPQLDGVATAVVLVEPGVQAARPSPAPRQLPPTSAPVQRPSPSTASSVATTPSTPSALGQRAQVDAERRRHEHDVRGPASRCQRSGRRVVGRSRSAATSPANSRRDRSTSAIGRPANAAARRRAP